MLVFFLSETNMKLNAESCGYISQLIIYVYKHKSITALNDYVVYY